MTDNDLKASEPFAVKYEAFVGRHGISGSVIKLIAIVSMLIDHIGAGILENRMYRYCMPSQAWMGTLNQVMRGIGRIAFPLFCFMLVEGYTHTRNVRKYLGRLALFGVIAEVPFDLAIFRTPWYTDYQNVFWTLALGVLMMMLMDKVSGFDSFKKHPQLNALAVVALDAVIFFVIAVIAAIFKTDYDVYGILTILVIYAFRGRRLSQLIALAAACWLILDELPALLCLIPLALYNGRRGFGMKYFFYAFYPAHLLAIWVAGSLMGLK